MRISDWSSDVCSSDLADGAATLTAFTAAAVARAIAQCPARPNAVHVAGGGRHNSTLMAMIGDRCGLPVAPVEQIGWNGDATERSEEHTSELQSLMRISYAVFCLKQKKQHTILTRVSPPTLSYGIPL